MARPITIPVEFIEGPIWNNDKPYSEGQAYIQFMVWADLMGSETKFINGNMVTLKPGEFIMTQRKIAESINWTQSAVNRFLKKLVMMNQCRINNESKMTRVSLSIVAVPQEPESIVNQEVNQADNLYDSFFGGRTNSTNSSNNYNIINNSTSNNNNTTTNSNILAKNDKKPSNSSVGRGKNVSYKAKPKDLQMVIDHFKEKSIEESEAIKFYSYYESIGWYRGKTKIKNWKMAVVNWVKISADSPQVKKKLVYKVSTAGDYLVYCHNKKCNNYGNSCFARNDWDIRKGCDCGHDWHNTRAKALIKPTSVLKIIEDRYAKEDKEKGERQERPKESPEGSRTTEGDSTHLSDILSGMFQS